MFNSRNQYFMVLLFKRNGQYYTEDLSFAVATHINIQLKEKK
jgi:hypothetical protein